MPSRATWVAFSAQYRITPAQSCKRKQPPAQEKMLLHKAVVLFQVLQYFLMQWNHFFLSVIAESNKEFLTIALKCPLSQARATLYRYCRQELSLVYMSAILPCINYTPTSTRPVLVATAVKLQYSNCTARLFQVCMSWGTRPEIDQSFARKPLSCGGTGQRCLWPPAWCCKTKTGLIMAK